MNSNRNVYKTIKKEALPVNRNKYVFILLIIGTMLLFTGCADKEKGDDTDDTVKIIAGHNQTSPDNPYQTGLLKFKEVAEELSNGTIEVEAHAGTIGTEELELVEKLQLGRSEERRVGKERRTRGSEEESIMRKNKSMAVR